MKSTQCRNYLRWLVGVVSVSAMFGSATAKAEPQAEFALPLRAGKTTQDAPQNDPLVILNAPANFPDFQILYSSYVPFEEGNPPAFWQHFITLHNVRAGNKNKDDTKTRFFEVASPLWLFYPRFSPNGNYVSLKVGDPFGMGSYGFFIWNLETQEVKPGPKVPLRYPRLAWSPNSQYIAYVEGGDASGRSSTPKRMVQLKIYDVKSSDSRLVMQGQSASDFSWTAKNSLLYSLQTGAAGSPPSIFEFDILADKPRLVLTGGVQPLASPDGKWLLFKATSSLSEKLKKETDAQSNQEPKSKSTLTSSWYLMNLNDKKYFNLPLSVFDNADLLWSTDSKSIIEMTRAENNKAVTINTLDIASMAKKKLAAITFQKKSKSEQVENNAVIEFTLLSLTKNGKFVLVHTSESGDLRPAEGLQDGYGFLLAVETNSGRVHQLVNTKNDSGFSFYETGQNALAP